MKKLASHELSDHRSYMISNLKSAKAHLSELVEKASQGEEIWLTVRGKPKARICPLPNDQSAKDKIAWVESVREARAKYGQQNDPDDTQALWDELRGE
jgi:prevent-host-death family protein